MTEEGNEGLRKIELFNLYETEGFSSSLDSLGSVWKTNSSSQEMVGGKVDLPFFHEFVKNFRVLPKKPSNPDSKPEGFENVPVTFFPPEGEHGFTYTTVLIEVRSTLQWYLTKTHRLQS